MTDILTLAEQFNDRAALMLRRNPDLGEVFSNAMTRVEFRLLEHYESDAPPNPVHDLKKAELVAAVLDRAVHGKARRKIKALVPSLVRATKGYARLHEEMQQKAPVLARLYKPVLKAI